MNCIDVLKSIIKELHIESACFTLFEHFVATNWRVRYPSVSQKLNYLKEGLVHHSPYREWKLLGEEILSDAFNPSKLVSRKGHVVSVSSKIICNNGRVKHLAMMNLHPENGLSYDDIVMIVEAVTDGMPGYLLESGRYYHFYGVTLLEECEWACFIAQFLMPTLIVSPRYIGHCMHRGYVALRLSTQKDYKPLLPKVCGLVGALKQKEHEIGRLILHGSSDNV